MPRRKDINSIMVIGAGPIIIGQACEFDYSGTQACRALREEGYKVVLVNSNPATVMTDPDMADSIYIEPIRIEYLQRIIELERPDALLPTMGGQTALNCAMQLVDDGVLDKYGVQLIGADRKAIAMAEDRKLFREAMQRIGLNCAKSFVVQDMEQANGCQSNIGYPILIRPSFTLGGSGGGIAWNSEEFADLCERGLRLSPVTQILLEQPVLGWKEFEMEVVRDCRDNCIIICSIENIDAMGVHTGDSITVAPSQTLTDKEYQKMRDASFAILREIGVETGGSNVQFAVNPDDGEMLVIEMNPRVSRSSALASKATGFPIAKVAAKLAVGYTLDELANEITGGVTPASFEPVLDYVVVKAPRFDFEKFQGVDDRLGTQMKSVGEAMAIGRTFQEAIHKVMRSLETGICGFESLPLPAGESEAEEEIMQQLRMPRCHRLRYVAEAFRRAMPVSKVAAASGIDPWFLRHIEILMQQESKIASDGMAGLDQARLRDIKRLGFADARIAQLLDVPAEKIYQQRQKHAIKPVYKRVDSCAAEFPAATAYMYSCYEDECESAPDTKRKIMILGGGPNRIGQGIEFDYCCVHAAQALREDGYETIMVNCNPETVSTDYDISDRLYFEPLTHEDVLSIFEVEKPDGVIVQFGGQTPLSLARGLEQAGLPIIGTSPTAIDQAEDRDHFRKLLTVCGLRQPSNAIARSRDQVLELAVGIGYPLVVRPSYVLGGRAMEIVYGEDDLRSYLQRTCADTWSGPMLLDRFLEDAIEVDVDAVCDGTVVRIGAIMEHIEQAGVHSGDSACCLPPHSLSQDVQSQLMDQVRQLALALGVIGLVNVQFAVRGKDIYVLEVNPRASRTVPFISKATGLPLAKVAVRCMVGMSLSDQKLPPEVYKPPYYAVKEAVFPFDKLPGVDSLLGPEMHSTGEVMGIGQDFSTAFYKAQQAIHRHVPQSGTAFISVRDVDKPAACGIAASLLQAGFKIVATSGTAAAIKAAGLDCQVVHKVHEGRPHVVDMIKDGQIDFIVNTTEGKQAIADSYEIRRTILQRQIFYMTTIAGASAATDAICRDIVTGIVNLHTYHQQLKIAATTAAGE
ncbi:MAG: carbamoyl-phosphate synthase large subunit [Candidatus Porifericomitaceae bacterium WSBS_2022_MAG_OTU9]